MAEGTACNLLTEPLISVRTAEGQRLDLTLPGVLCRLATRDIEAFCALRRHQRQPWFCFLVQLAAIALNRQGLAGVDAGAATEDDWCAWLRDLTAGQNEPWCLVVEDLSKPAMLQPPVPEGAFAKKSKKAEGTDLAAKDKEWSEKLTADDLDMLVTAKDHDVKIATAARALPEQWMFALVSVQTMDGFGGQSINGIARMNGGYGSRALVAYAPGRNWGARWRRDVARCLAGRASVAELQGLEGDLALTWLVPWDGSDSLALADLDPLFIEVCRRIRLVDGEGGITARSTGTAVLRIAAKDRNGRVGDPWCPVGKEGGAALSVSKQGFHYAKVVELAFGGDWQHGGAYGAERADAGLLMQALTRGQGKTEGLHERWLPIPPRARGRTADAALAATAVDRVKQAAEARKSVLRPAVLTLQQAAPDKLKMDAKSADPWTMAFDRRVDEHFFERLWEDADLDPDTAQATWGRWLFEQCRALLAAAIDATPFSGPRRYRAIAAAEGVLYGAAVNKHLILPRGSAGDSNPNADAATA
jgi:CRISPR system Cascade subunit CasA